MGNRLYIVARLAPTLMPSRGNGLGKARTSQGSARNERFAPAHFCRSFDSLGNRSTKNDSIARRRFFYVLPLRTLLQYLNFFLPNQPKKNSVTRPGFLFNTIYPLWYNCLRRFQLVAWTVLTILPDFELGSAGRHLLCAIVYCYECGQREREREREEIPGATATPYISEYVCHGKPDHRDQRPVKTIGWVK